MLKKNKLYSKKNCYKKEINLETKKKPWKIERVKKKMMKNQKKNLKLKKINKKKKIMNLNSLQVMQILFN